MRNLFFVPLVSAGLLLGQIPNPTQQTTPVPMPPGEQPFYRVTVVSRTISAINYHHRTGTTQVGFRGTNLMPQAKGDAKVESRMGSTKIDTKVDDLKPATSFGPEYLTYVLWAITPEGRAQNLGELVLDRDHASLLSTTDLQAFGLIVTAEPYFAVTQPSDVVVMENFVTSKTAGTIEQVNAKYELLKRGTYVLNESNYKGVVLSGKGPLQVAEAQNAVQIAELAGAQRYAPDTLRQAQTDLQNAEDMIAHGGKDKRVETNAREAAQMAEDARIITLRKIADEQQAQQQAEAAQAKATAETEAQRRAAAEQAKEEALVAQQQAEAERQRAQAAAQLAEQQKAEALAQQEAAQAQAEQARLTAQQATAEQQQLRERLRQQLGAVLQTRETARGLIMSMPDVLFNTGSSTLKPSAQLTLAKVSGILLAYPSLRLQIDGYTDSTGSADFNQQLSEKRADAVRNFLVSQGISPAEITAQGFGQQNPIASNATAEGRQQNRRVELVVSGQAIGTQGQ